MEIKNIEIREQDVKRFWNKVDIKSEEECWEWLGVKDRHGYGEFSIRHNRRVRAPRMSYTLTKGDILDGLNILHSCDNPKCCNPNHLSVGTQHDNVQDMLTRGRNNPEKHSLPGSKNGSSKLEEKDIYEIFRLYFEEKLNQEEIGKTFSITTANVSSILKGKSWGYLNIRDEYAEHIKMQGVKHNIKYKVSESEIDNIFILFYEKHMAKVDIARLYNIKPGYVLSILSGEMRIYAKQLKQQYDATI